MYESRESFKYNYTVTESNGYGEKATPNDIGCQSLQFATNYTNQVLLDVIADLKRDLDMHELTFKDYQYDLWNLIYYTFL